MLPHRLARLSRLTQGLALVGLGISAPACATPPAKDPAPRDGELHINAPPTPPATGTATAAPGTAAPPGTVAATEADAGPVTPGPAAPVYINSPPPGPARPGPPAQAPMPDHVNSPPPAKPALPKRVNSPPPSPAPTK